MGNLFSTPQQNRNADDFFVATFGFSEIKKRDTVVYEETQQKLSDMATFEPVPVVQYFRERCFFMLPHTGATLDAGIFSMPTVEQLRERVKAETKEGVARIRVQNVVGDARSLHAQPENAGAVFQAAGQFNVLEFAAPYVTPEEGIERYVKDPTQGPACAIACAAGTAYRNYLVPIPFEDQRRRGQTETHQLNGLADIETHLDEHHHVSSPWTVKNGYIDSSVKRISRVNELLGSEPGLKEELTSLLRIGVQEDTTVTDTPSFDVKVTQTYNSAVSIGYSALEEHLWKPIAQVVLDGTYEATLLVGILKSIEEGSNGSVPIYLTKVGGGVFRNKDEWIVQAITRAINSVKGLDVDLDIRIVHFGQLDPAYDSLDFTRAAQDKKFKKLLGYSPPADLLECYGAVLAALESAREDIRCVRS
jgi:hypothetical protein